LQANNWVIDWSQLNIDINNRRKIIGQGSYGRVQIGCYNQTGGGGEGQPCFCGRAVGQLALGHGLWMHLLLLCFCKVVSRTVVLLRHQHNLHVSW
jgi:hypothetical protein